jgi:hypothetical protein
VHLRVTEIRDNSGRLHTLRNGNIEHIVNFSRDYVHAVVDLGVAYDSNLDTVWAAIRDAGARLRVEFPDALMKDTFVAGVEEFGDTAVTVRTITQVHPGSHLPVARALRRHLLAACAAHGVEIPYPHLVVIQQNPPTNAPPSGRADPMIATRRRVPLMSLLVALLPACGGDDASSSGVAAGDLHTGGTNSLSAFASAYVDAVCARAARCDPAGATVGQAACDRARAEFESSSFPLLQAAVDAETVAFREPDADVCVNLLKTATCEDSLLVDATCRAVFAGTLFPGSDCTLAAECSEGLFCDLESTCPGTCKERLGPGRGVHDHLRLPRTADLLRGSLHRPCVEGSVLHDRHAPLRPRALLRRRSARRDGGSVPRAGRDHRRAGRGLPPGDGPVLSGRAGLSVRWFRVRPAQVRLRAAGGSDRRLHVCVPRSLPRGHVL